MPDPSATVYVLHWHADDAPGGCVTEVFADRHEAVAATEAHPDRSLWGVGWALSGGAFMPVAPDPTGYASWSVAPEPGRWCVWTAAAMEKREGAR